MRLNATELRAIRTTLGPFDPQGWSFLYGSRIDDTRRGGDIDIFLEGSREIDLRTTLALQVRLSAACDTKVDLLIKTPGEVEMPIHGIARLGLPL